MASRTVFIARFIFLFPPIVANLLAGMAKMPWRTFLFYNLTGSAAYTTTYILIGYFFGKMWKLLEAWLGSTALYQIFAGIILMVLGVILDTHCPNFRCVIFQKDVSESINEQHSTVKFLEHLL
jgi:membrane protein DedA with SNARE-associated domain